MSQIKQQSAMHILNVSNPHQAHLNPHLNITQVNQISNNRQGNKIENAQQASSYHLHSKTIDDSLKSSGHHFGNKQIGNNSLKKSFASNYNGESSKVKYNNKRYNTLKNNDNIKRIQRLYTDSNGCPQFHSRLLLPNNSQNTYTQKSLIQSYPQQEAKSHQQYNKQHPPNLSKQELYQQNMKLKNKLNQMKDTLTRQKIQTEIQKKKNKKYTMQLNREFKKELYINNMKGSKMPQETSQEQRIAKMYTNQESDPQNEQIVEKYHQFSQILPKTSYYRIPASLGPPSLQPHSTQYMIAGIKQKYEQLRTEYEKIAKQLKAMKAIDSVKKLEEVSVYCVTLQQSNSRLAIALNVANKKLYAYQNPDGQTIQAKKKDIEIYSQAVVEQIRNKCQSLKLKNSIKNQQNKKLKQQQKQNQKLIKYLEAILTSKSTLLYNQQRAMKKNHSAIKQIEAQFAQQKKLSQILRQTYMTQMQQISEKYEKKVESQKKLFQQALIQKNYQIKKLQKQIAYLNMIVDNWRGSEDKEKDKGKEERQKDEQKSISTAKKRKQSTLNAKIDFDKDNEKNSASNSFIKYTERKQLQKQYDQKVSQLASYTNRAHMNSREDQLQRANTKDRIKMEQRKRKSSGFKNSQNSKKLRKVSIEQIIDIAQFIRYRFIGSKKSIDDLTELLNYNPKQTQDQNEGIKWKKQYISQGELRIILQNEPFMVPSPMSDLLSRYVVEDQCLYQNGNSDNAFVYADPINEIQRTIARSILKAFIQTTSNAFISLKNVNSVFQQCQKQWGSIIEKYGSKINTPLISIASSGFISKERWNQLLSSLSIQVSEYLREWCVGKMLLQSQNLSRLKYRSIIPDYI